MGLATVYGIVKQSGGFIWVTSEVGVGTSFENYLPAVSGTIEAIDAVKPAAHVERGSETILIAEDDDSVRRLACQTLTTFGYRVFEARDGNEALALAHEFPGVIHLLVTDIVMPGLTGPALAERLKTVRPATRVLFTSSYADTPTALPELAPVVILAEAVPVDRAVETRAGHPGRVVAHACWVERERPGPCNATHECESPCQRSLLRPIS